MHPTLKLLPFLPLLAAKSTTPVNTDPYTGYSSDSGDWSLEFDTGYNYGHPFYLCCTVQIYAFGCIGEASFGECQDGGTPSNLCASVKHQGPFTSPVDNESGCGKDASITVDFSTGCPYISFQQNIGQPDEEYVSCTAGIDNLVNGDYTRTISFDDLSHCNQTSVDPVCPT